MSESSRPPAGPPMDSSPTILIARLRQILLANGTVTAADKEWCLSALDSLESTLTFAQTGSGGDPDAYLLRNHHAKMGECIVATDLEIEALDGRRLEIQAGHDAEIARLRIIEGQLEREHRARIRDNELERNRVTRNFKDPAWIERKLQDLDAKQAALIHKRVVCAHIITAEAFQSAPIRRVPDDILIEIFAAVTAGELEPVGTGFASILAQVCARWRGVACNHPHLWSSFSFPAFGADGITLILQLVLQRARGIPLSVVVDTTHRNLYTPRPSNEASNVDILGTRAANIVRLRFQGSGEFPSFPLLAARLGRLEHLQFAQAWHPDAALKAPRLHTLGLARSADLLDLKSLIPVAQIRTLHFSVSTSGHHLGTFENLTDMVSLQTSDPPAIWTAQAPPPLGSLATWRVELPHVHGLGVPAHTKNFFGRFCTPVLRTLHIRRLTSAEGLTALLHRSGCALSTLVLEEPLIASPDILSICKATPSLETLAITSGGVDVLEDDFFTELTLTDALPRLTEFRVEGSYNFSTEALISMVESRTSASSSTIARLRKVDLDLTDRVLSLVTIRTLLKTAGVVLITDKSGVRRK
ncbi:hypothetical protein C8R46DRAFT_1092657 [Mycena filopes]|nr:hypothetical protein C8R46DRAFT_1092657 [Mycena filopes]